MRHFAIIGLLGIAACGETSIVNSSEQAIVGGDATQDFPEACELLLPDNDALSCVLVGERTVLTAGHSLIDVIHAGTFGQVQVYFGPDSKAGAPTEGVLIGAEDAIVPAYLFVDTDAYYDIGVVLLAEAPDIAPAVLHDGSLDELLTPGDTVTLAGFGTEFEGDTSHVKRRVDVTVDGLTPRHISEGTPGKSSCFGDSGGPVYLSDGTNRKLVGVISRAKCGEGGFHTRIDTYLDEFIHPVLDRWEGPCREDGQCVTDGCRTVDPDCDACGFNGECAEGCPTRDLDCPIGTRYTEPCADDSDCASGFCLSTDADPEARYCSLPCFPETRAAVTCFDWMTCEVVSGYDEQLCVFQDASLGAQGASCEHDADCRLGFCHKKQQICALPCATEFSPASHCPEGFMCRPDGRADLCSLPPDEGGCGCAVGIARPSGAPGLLIVTVVAGVLLRRRHGQDRAS